MRRGRLVWPSGRLGRADIPYSTKRVPADSPRQHADSTWPFLMNGKVVANGDRVRDYAAASQRRAACRASPDRALVGEEEELALDGVEAEAGGG